MTRATVVTKSSSVVSDSRERVQASSTERPQQDPSSTSRDERVTSANEASSRSRTATNDGRRGDDSVRESRVGSSRARNNQVTPDHRAEESTLVLHLRVSREKAKVAAVEEVKAVLRDYEAIPLPGGPLSEQRGVFWFKARGDETALRSAPLERLGYTEAVDLLTPTPAKSANPKDPTIVRWKGETYRLTRLYQNDVELELKRGPDQRTFLLADEHGQVREVRGYRGDGGELSRRALPVCDSKLLVNLVTIPTASTFLDPFAGAGGIVQEAVSSGLQVFSIDIDPKLKPGLERMGAVHTVGSATSLPWPDGMIDAIATEPPYSKSVEAHVLLGFDEMVRVLKPGGRLAMLCSAEQSDALRRASAYAAVTPILDCPLDRKGTPCHILAWEKRVE